MIKHLSLATLLSLVGCSDYDLQYGGKDGNGGGTSGDSGEPYVPPDVPEDCDLDTPAAENVGEGDNCATGETGGFTPVVEWEAGNKSCLAMPVVADLDGDGMPEILINESYGPLATGTMNVYRGNGGGLKFSLSATVGYGSPAAVGDITGDGKPNIVVVNEYSSSMTGVGDYTIKMFSSSGSLVWESDHFEGLDFDYATAPTLSDMDHDGRVEIVAGRVILNDDGSTRGIGAHGRGSYGVLDMWGIVMSEASVPAVADLDLDGIEEVIVGNAMYSPDGDTIISNLSQEDAMVAIANLDNDVEGEAVMVSYDTVRAVDTDGSIMWGPKTIPGANIVSPAAIADLDGDGKVEIVVAGGNKIWTLNHDGTLLWSATVQDESGATGASIFDFEGDGDLEVIYIDETQMVAYEGATGNIKYQTSKHSSVTMFDYPVIADVDADGQAELLVCHDGHTSSMTVFGDADNSWASTRSLWNQYQYGITNVNDDLTIPMSATPNFRSYNTWHAAPTRDAGSSGDGVDLEAEIIDVCSECEEGIIYVSIRAINRGVSRATGGIDLALYKTVNGTDRLVDTMNLSGALNAGWSTGAAVFEVPMGDLANASSIWLVVDDDGTGTGSHNECSELNNGFIWGGPFCED